MSQSPMRLEHSKLSGNLLFHRSSEANGFFYFFPHKGPELMKIMMSLILPV
jgi:hypothetical protein